MSANDSGSLDSLPQDPWSFQEIKQFEVALAASFHDPDRFAKVAAELPGKSVEEVSQRYAQLEEEIRSIEEGRVPLPEYSACSGEPSYSQGSKKPKEAPINGDRRKGVPWTEEEHRLFLLGLAKFGKGDWRSIARNFVVSRTPTQVASHAQKYFIRLNSMNKKDKRRSSIHDITSVGMPDYTMGMPPPTQTMMHGSGMLPMVAGLAGIPGFQPHQIPIPLGATAFMSQM